MTATEIVFLVTGILAGVPLVFGAIALACTPFVRGREDSLFVGFFRVITRVYARVLHGIRPQKGTDILPSEGACIVVANHQSGADPALIAALSRRLIRFLMAREYYETRGLRWLFRAIGCIPVNRDGSDLSATRAALKLLRSGAVIGLFPQGGIRDADDPLGVAKAGVALLALRTGSPVVPIYIEGSPAFDSVLLGVFWPSRTKLHCGEPLAFESAGPRPTREELAHVTDAILEAIRTLKARADGTRLPERARSEG